MQLQLSQQGWPGLRETALLAWGGIPSPWAGHMLFLSQLLPKRNQFHTSREIHTPNCVCFKIMNSGIIIPTALQGTLGWMYSFCISRASLQQINGPVPELNALKKGQPTPPVFHLSLSLSLSVLQGFCCLGKRSKFSASSKGPGQTKKEGTAGSLSTLASPWLSGDSPQGGEVLRKP